MRQSVLLLGFLLGGALNAQRFYPDDPLLKDPEPIRVEDAAFRKLNDYYDLFLHTLGEPGEQQPVKGGRIRARSINTLDEVPDSRDWFTNRIGAREMSIEEIARGPIDERPPPGPGIWKIVGAKTEGVTPGFRIEDETGETFMLKFDPLTNPEMATGADVIGSGILHALGYNVPENYLVVFDPERLVVAEGATMPGETGGRRAISKLDVSHALTRLPRGSDGRIRAVASHLLHGKVLGEFRYFDTRSDDFNDTIPHEHRRELRGLFVIAAWLNHNDSRAINALDVLVEEDGLKFVKHYLIDFGAILGSASVLSNTARDGNAYFFEKKPTILQVFTLGAYVPRWARAKYHRSPAIGMINYEAFEPDNWKPNYPNPAFDNRLPDDEFWAAKKVMAFTDQQIHAIVKKAQYSNPDDEAWLTQYLIERRNRIGRTYFAKVLPLDGFAIEGGRITFEDLAGKYGFESRRDYSVQWSRFDNEKEEHQPIDGAVGFKLPPAVTAFGPSSYFAAAIRADDGGKRVMVYVRAGSDAQPRVVGVERFW